MERRFQFIIISVIVFLSLIVLVIANTILHLKTEELKNNIYITTTEQINHEIDLLMKHKKQSTLALALALSRDQFMIKALKDKDPSELKLDELSLKLREFTRFKNVWFQIIDHDGYSFYRSWIEKRGDKIANVRVDIQEMLKKPKVMSSLSVGKFDITFKSMVPIYDDNNTFLGIFEIITHFNSVSKKLREEGFEVVILADKKYKKQLIHPFTNNFIGDYYVANLDANENLKNIIALKTVQSYLNKKEKFYIDKKENLYTTLYRISSNQDENLGYFIVFKYLDTFAIDNVKNIRQNIIVAMIFIIIFIVVFGYYIFNKKYHSLLQKNLDFTKEEKNKIKAVLSAQPYIIILVNKNKSYDVNDEFFYFFPQYKSLDAFKQDIDCICKLFVKPDKDDGTYIYNNNDWIATLITNQDKEFKVAMYKEKELHHFILKASQPRINNRSEGFAILTFIDITEQKKKDELLYEQSKNASMGEMIANIAHQWRQPLSIISTAATGMMMQKQMGVLNDEVFENSCTQINDNSQYLSKTIDDFRDFLKEESKIVPFSIKNALESFLHLVEPVAKDNNLEIISSLNEDFIINGNQNELLQCFINIFNNSKDAFLANKEIDKRYFFIKIVFDSKDTIIIEFKDNACGIPPDVIGKVFEPYFTTKHKSQGTGLGLSMTYQLITSQMNGAISVDNDEFEYNDIKCQGAKFTIVLSSIKT